jgi:DNA polymerase
VGNSRQQQYLDGLQFVRWVRRDDQSHSIDRGLGASQSSTEKELFELATVVDKCKACSLHQTRKRTVFGAGSSSAECLFVGEAPGSEEDRHGLPFVGRAGELLDAMILALGLEREETYIANVLKCRPPENRNPLGEEVGSCETYLHRQIQLIEPRLIIALGKFAAQSLLKTSSPIGKLRGRSHRYEPFDVPLIATYHPAYLLRSPLEKRKVWSDLRLAKTVLTTRG